MISASIKSGGGKLVKYVWISLLIQSHALSWSKVEIIPAKSNNMVMLSLAEKVRWQSWDCIIFDCTTWNASSSGGHHFASGVKSLEFTLKWQLIVRRRLRRGAMWPCRLFVLWPSTKQQPATRLPKAEMSALHQCTGKQFFKVSQGSRATYNVMGRSRMEQLVQSAAGAPTVGRYLNQSSYTSFQYFN